MTHTSRHEKQWCCEPGKLANPCDGAAWKSIATRYTPSTRCWPRESVGSMAWDSLVYLRTAEVTGILKDVFMS